MLVTANVFGPLIDVFETVLKFFHNSGGISWGLSIVLLTIAVRAVLIPLTFRQIKSMVRMQGLSPQMKEIQAKYKDDKQRQQQEIMKFYKENNVNPLGSCLPLVLQLPVFVSLYYMLKKNLRNDICPKTQALFREAYHTAHHVTLAAAHSETTACGHVPAAHFLFIHDLTAKATGIELGILIVLYVGSQLGSSLLMSAATMDPTQRKVMLFMPLIFVLFVIRFPAGLLLYWITTNLWTVIQQYTVRRYIGPTVAVVPAGASGGSSKSGGGSLTGSGGTGNGSGSGGVGGLGARLRDRLSAAQAGGAEGRAETAKALRSNGAGSSAAGSSEKVAGTGSKGSGSSSRGRSGNGNGTRGGGPSSASAGASSKAASGRGRRGASSSNGSGSSNGDGSSTGGNGNGARAGAPPPRPPRKKKKRSGRRR